MDVWDELRFYENRHALLGVARDRLGLNSFPAAQVDEIIACLQQARDYFRAARDAAPMIRPLVLYYGMMSLAAGLVLVCGGKERSRLSLLGNHHGLELVRDPAEHLESFGCRLTRAGLYRAFLDTFACDIAFEFPGTYAARLKLANASEVEGRVMTLKSLTARVPRLWRLFEKTFNRSQTVVRVEIMKPPIEGPYVFTFPDGARAPEGWEKVWPVGTGVMTARSGPGDATEVTRITASSVPPGYSDWLEVYDGAVGWPFAVHVVVQREDDDSSWISPWEAQLAGMFILASIARYQPVMWGRLLGRDSNSSVFSLIEAFLSTAERDFPVKALEILERVRVVKGFVTTLDRLIVGSLP